jgi:hypothetical protein
MVIGMQPTPIITKVVSSNPAHGEVYSIQHYVIQLSGRYSPPIKLRYDTAEILLKVT